MRFIVFLMHFIHILYIFMCFYEFIVATGQTTLEMYESMLIQDRIK